MEYAASVSTSAQTGRRYLTVDIFSEVPKRGKNSERLIVMITKVMFVPQGDVKDDPTWKVYVFGLDPDTQVPGITSLSYGDMAEIVADIDEIFHGEDALYGHPQSEVEA